MNKKFMDEEDNHNLTNFIIRLSLEDKPEEFLEDYFTSIENIYGKDGSKRHLYSTIFSILYFIDDKKDYPIYVRDDDNFREMGKVIYEINML